MFVFKSSNVLICPVTLPVVIARARVLVLLTRDAPPIVIHVRIRNGLRIASTPPVVIPIFYAIVIEFGPHIFAVCSTRGTGSGSISTTSG